MSIYNVCPLSFNVLCSMSCASLQRTHSDGRVEVAEYHLDKLSNSSYLQPVFILIRLQVMFDFKVVTVLDALTDVL